MDWKTLINKIRDKKEPIQQIPVKFQKSLELILKTHIPLNWKNLREMDELLDIHDIPKLYQDEINNLN